MKMVNTYLQVSFLINFLAIKSQCRSTSDLFQNNGLRDIGSSTTCEHQTLNLDCGVGRTIKILDAVYGRSDAGTCYSYPKFTSACSADGVLKKIQLRCEDKQACSIQASNNEFGDPCAGTIKYLQVKHVCDIRRDIGWTTTCAGNVLKLDCGPGRTLKILDAVYGRSDAGTCYSYADFNSVCFADGVLRKLQLRCEDKQACSIEASNEEFGDPCNGIIKYLQVKHLCEIRRDIGWSTTCEHQTLKLECGLGRTIRVLDAVYGRSDSEKCHSYPRFTSTCSAEGVLRKLQLRCEHKQACSIQASNNEFGDPCVGIIKYLQVKHVCEIPRDVEWSVTCQGNVLNLDCGQGKAISILEAGYGIFDQRTCQEGKSVEVRCSAKDVLKKVQQRCNDHRKCNLNATNEVFGDPCNGLKSYLRIKHNCKAAKEWILSRQNTSLNLECGSGKSIKILAAVYGERNTSSSNALTGCPSNDVYNKLQHRCENKQNCSINATDEEFGNPCFGAIKYLQVKHKCESADLMKVDLRIRKRCGKYSCHLTCPDSNLYMSMSDAKIHEETPECSLIDVRTTNWHSAQFLETVKERCDRKQNCTLPADNYTESCYPFLDNITLEYRCVKA